MFKKKKASYLVCEHQDSIFQEGAYQIFTGTGTNCIIVCGDCFELDVSSIPTHTMSTEQSNLLDQEYNSIWNDFKGEPNILINHDDSFIEIIQKYSLEEVNLNDFLAITLPPKSLFLQLFALDKNLKIYRIDYKDDQLISSFLYQLDSWGKINYEESVSIEVFEHYVAIYNTYGQYGFVIDLDVKAIVLELDRKDYHVEHSIFPVAFFKEDNSHFIIHGTDWNRIDLYNLTLKKALTNREIDYKHKETYLDYFYGSLNISLNNKWVLSTGWAWHPVGVIHAFHLKEWIHYNIHEPENGNSKKDFNPMDDWDQSITWIKDQENLIGVWGYSPDSFSYFPAFTVWDVEKTEILHWFAGPEPELAYIDGLVFSWDSKYKKVSIWNAINGEQVYHNEDFKADFFHGPSKTFLSILKPSNTISLLKIQES